jgi:hypothetical protein
MTALGMVDPFELCDSLILLVTVAGAVAEFIFSKGTKKGKKALRFVLMGLGAVFCVEIAKLFITAAAVQSYR